ncbi:hypothetical protein BDZ91DRAFT_747695 [Kalaharituber pfeilii]|nr:hypothetical protein BDZ91DRAFT_747695 [Kalaharituber pfeilii]
MSCGIWLFYNNRPSTESPTQPLHSATSQPVHPQRWRAKPSSLHHSFVLLLVFLRICFRSRSLIALCLSRISLFLGSLLSFFFYCLALL